MSATSTRCRARSTSKKIRQSPTRRRKVVCSFVRGITSPAKGSSSIALSARMSRSRSGRGARCRLFCAGFLTVTTQEPVCEFIEGVIVSFADFFSAFFDGGTLARGGSVGLGFAESDAVLAGRGFDFLPHLQVQRSPRGFGDSYLVVWFDAND